MINTNEFGLSLIAVATWVEGGEKRMEIFENTLLAQRYHACRKERIQLWKVEERAVVSESYIGFLEGT